MDAPHKGLDIVQKAGSRVCIALLGGPVHRFRPDRPGPGGRDELTHRRLVSGQDVRAAQAQVTIKPLHVTVGGALNEILAPLGRPANSPLLTLDLSFPEL